MEGNLEGWCERLLDMNFEVWLQMLSCVEWS
jgi:hypothetical protein